MLVKRDEEANNLPARILLCFQLSSCIYSLPLVWDHLEVMSMNDIRVEYRRFARRPLWWIGSLLALFFIAELGFDVTERAIGQYLYWHNPGRQRIGRSWQEDQNRLLANSRLETLTRDSRARESALEGVTDFAALVDYAQSSPRLVLPPAQFSKIYNAVPEIFRPWLISPNDLLMYHQQQSINHVLVDRHSDRLEVFFLDSGNQILHQATLFNEQITMMLSHGQESPINVRTAERFIEHVYEAQDFYRRLDHLFYDDRERIIRALPALTDLDKHLVAVAFGNRLTSGFVETALALDDTRAVIYYLPEEWIIDFVSSSRRHEGWNNF